MIDKHQRAIDAFGAFAEGLVRDLDQMSAEGWAVLVEGRRDAKALRALGFSGRIAETSAYNKKGTRAFGGKSRVVILTDLDREGSVLAARYVKALTHDGLVVSLAERRRLKHASKGLFLHIENLARFGHSAMIEPT